MARKAPKAEERSGESDYFPERQRLTFIKSGSILLDCVLGKGWPLGRIVNIVGDKSTGKTLLAIEAMNQFARAYPKGKIFYRDAEAAFDADYAKALGLPLERIHFGPKNVDTQWRTIEDVFEDLQRVIARYKGTDRPGLYVIDSLDALSTRAGLKRDLGEGYRLDKPKLLSELFERLVGDLRECNICLVVINQVRDKIGFVIGEKHRRSGGRAMDFYASIALWLTHIKTHKKTIHGEKRAWGVRIKAETKKNKIISAFLQCQFDIRFNYGIDDIPSALEYLAEKGELGRVGLTKKSLDDGLKRWWRMNDREQDAFVVKVHKAVRRVWRQADEDFAPPRPKYRPLKAD